MDFRELRCITSNSLPTPTTTVADFRDNLSPKTATVAVLSFNAAVMLSRLSFTVSYYSNSMLSHCPARLSFSVLLIVTVILWAYK